MDLLGGSSPRRSPDSDADVASPAASSNYSSCDGSEFDRYCSANSALGSASLCSSVGNYSELLDSFKVSNRWNGYDGLLDCGGFETPRENGQDAVSMDGMSPSSSRIRAGSRLFRTSTENSTENSPSLRGESAESASGFTEEKIGLQDSEADDSRFDQRGNGHLKDANFMDGMSSLAKIRSGSTSSLKAVEKSSSVMDEAADNAINRAIGSATYGEEIGFSENLSWDGSEGEDSDYGSGEESRILYVKRNNLQCSKEVENDAGNPLVMNSLVAFGANDWDEFEQERGEDGFGSISLCEDGLVQQQSSVNHVNIPSVIEKETDVKTQPGDYVVSSSQRPQSEEISRESFVKLDCSSVGREIETPSINSKKLSSGDAGEASAEQIVDESEPTVTPLCNSIFEQSFNALDRAFKENDISAEDIDEFSPLLRSVGIGRELAFETMAIRSSDSMDMTGQNLLPNEEKKLDAFDSCDDMVLEMEEILLDSGNSHGARSPHANGGHRTPNAHHFRDGSSTASTSGTDDAYSCPQYPPNIDRVEVVGAKQKKGDVSFGERLVGVKEYTIYKLRVWSSKDQWEVERRYRDFFALYRQLLTLFTDQGLSLPSPWSKVERESRKIFGNASPDVISDRSSLIQDCLQSILNSKYTFGTPSPLVLFLSRGPPIPNSGLLKSLVPLSLHKLRTNSFSFSPSKDNSTLGKTISLVVEIKPRKSMRQLLESQHYTCAGCHSQFDAGKTLFREFVQTIGWNKPRLCEYTGQIFCASCHTNDTGVLPAKVLHHWDFSLYPVSQLAKAYLESIYDQPMLCVSAVNPFLFSKVPALLHVMGIRKKIGAMIPYVRCPFRKAVQRSLGIRRYLLESNDFFALRDLVDLSKGAFAGLPVTVENVSSKILEHITEQCLVCYDSGIPCAARQDCDDPTSLIFPFQEAEAEKCIACGSLFHKPCFVKLIGCCPCGKSKDGGRRPVTGPIDLEEVSDRSTVPSGSTHSTGLLSEIISKARPDKMWRPKDSSPVILMGSLPSTSL